MDCHICGKETKPTVMGKYRQHKMPDSRPGIGIDICDASGTFVPAAELPGATEYVKELDNLASRQLEAYREKINSAAVTPFSQPSPVEVEEPTLFSQPAGKEGRPEPVPMNDLGKEVTARLKEMFHQFSNRQERSQQTTLGPSEIGSPCDRRLAMSLMRMPRVNPGGDGWASFVGTCVHAGLAEMFVWADADSGRYAVETPLTFPSEHVPRGTGDLLDRTLLMFADHKAMGRWSRDKLKSKGPSPVYRVQVHTYAYGARQRGEEVDYVAIIGWPRDEATLDDLYVWTEPYDPKIAIVALARVDAIAEKVKRLSEPMHPDGEWSAGQPWEVAKEFDVADDCRFCPFHLPNARSLKEGCNGKR